MKNSQNGSCWNGERSIVFGTNPTSLPSSSASSSSSSSTSQSTSIDGVSFSEGDLLLQALNGFVLVVTSEGYVFYTSPTIQDFLGFHQSDVIHQSAFELIHTDDRALFRNQLHFAFNPTNSQQDSVCDSPSDQSSAEISTNMSTYDPKTIPPENSSFLERNFCCRFRCLLDNSSGFLPLNFRGRLKFVYGQNQMAEDGALVHPQLALFAIATPMQPPSIVEIRAKTLLFQTKHRLDFTPMGIDTRGKIVLGYNEIELCMKGSGYNFIHAADMMYCADNHVRMIKTGESGFTVFRLLTKSGSWVWVQANARLVFKDGRPDFIVARQRALTNEEGEEQLHLRRLQLPFNFTTGEAMLYDVAPAAGPPEPCSTPKQRKLDNCSVSPNSILGCMMNQDQSLYHNNNNVDDLAFKDTHATLSVPGDVWMDATFRNVTDGLVKPEATVQDMMDTLQQILGENQLSDTLDVEPEELKSWESTLLKLSSSCDVGDDLCDILSNDVLTYVEEQLQREGAFQTPEQLCEIPPCADHQSLRSFSWTGELQDQLPPGRGTLLPQLAAPASATMTLTHIDLPQMTSAGSDGPALQLVDFQQSSGLQLESCAQAPPRLQDAGLGAFPANQNHCLQAPRPVQSHPASVQEPDPIFTFQGNAWSSNPSQPDPFAGSYSGHVSSQRGYGAEPPVSGCLQGHFALREQNSDRQKQSWLLDQQQPGACLSQRKPLQKAVNANVNSSLLRSPKMSSVPYAAQFSAASSTCMFGDAAPTAPSCQRLNPTAKLVPSQSSCLYGGAPGGGAVPAMASVLDPDEATLTCKSGMALGPEDLLVRPHPYLSVNNNHTQINGGPVIGNGGFPFSSMPNGIDYYSESN